MKIPETTTHQIENPDWLWRVFKRGPAAEYSRINHRISALVAVDVLVNCPDELTEEEQQLAESLATEVDFVDV